MREQLLNKTGKPKYKNLCWVTVQLCSLISRRILESRCDVVFEESPARAKSSHLQRNRKFGVPFQIRVDK